MVIGRKSIPDVGQGSEVRGSECLSLDLKAFKASSSLKSQHFSPVINPHPPLTRRAPETRLLPVIDLNLRGNYFPRDLFVCFF